MVEVRELRTTNRQLQNRHGGVKYSIGNGVAKEFIGITHRYEQWWGDGLGGLGGRQRGEYWNNCNSIINKIQLNK